MLYLSKQHAMEYNLIVEAAEEGGFIGYVPEIPGAHTQGETKEEVRQNIVEAIQLIQEVRKEDALAAARRSDLKGADYTLESITL